MAKKQNVATTPTDAKPINLNQMLGKLVKQHNTIDPDSAQFGEEELGSAVTCYIPTGSIALDTIISNDASFGGWPCGRIVEIYGEQAYGKTSMCFQAMANTQRMGGIVIFYDIERAASSELMSGYGIDVEQIVYSNLSTVEEIFQSLQDNLALISQTPDFDGKPIYVVIDSLAAMKSKKLEEGSYDYNMNTQGEFAKILGLALKRSLEYLSKANACLTIINQQRDKIGSFVPGKTTPGGNAIKFYATLRCVLLGKKHLMVKEEVTGDEVPYGAEVTIRTDKNKLGPPIRSVSFKLNFTQGIDEIEEWISYLSNLGMVEGKGNYTFTEKFPLKGYVGAKFRKGSFQDKLEDPELYDCIVDLIKKAFVRKKDEAVKLAAEQEKASKIEE